MWIVYRHVNRENQKSYVGFTPRTSKLEACIFESMSPEQISSYANKLLMTRWKSHVYSAKKGARWAFQRAIRKYGHDAFDHMLLEVCTSLDDALAREQHWIKTYCSTVDENGYNETKGGEGIKRTEAGRRAHREAMNRPEARKRNSEAQKRFWEMNPERRQLRAEVTHSIMSQAGMKEKVSLRTREAMQSSVVKEKIALKMSDPAFIEKRSEGIKKSWQEEATRKKHAEAEIRLLLSGKKGNKKVQQIDMTTGEVINVFLSICDASRKTSTPKSSLMSCLRGVLKHAGGFLWRYL